MRQMGLNSQEIPDAQEIVIKCNNKNIVISHPQVLKLVVQGQTIYQIIGGLENSEEEGSKGNAQESGMGVDQDDISFVCSQANVSVDVARRALIESKGDVAAALLKLTNKN
jgi:nascent polypeptide-associated complex subunit alpha